MPRRGAPTSIRRRATVVVGLCVFTASRVALAAFVVIQLFVDRRRALTNQVWYDCIGAYPRHAVAIVTGFCYCGPRIGVALCEPSSRLGRPCNLRSGLARYRRRYPCIATRQTYSAANGTPQVEPVGTSLSQGKPDEANHQRKDKEPRGGANPNGEPGIARTWLINVGHFAKPGKRVRQICRGMRTAPAGSHSWRRSTPAQAPPISQSCSAILEAGGAG